MALFVLSLCPFDISVGVGAFVIGLSQISSIFSLQIEVQFLFALGSERKQENLVMYTRAV